MARLIVKSPYIKCGTGQSAGGYLKYIATRERVEIIPDDRPPTNKQEQLIAKLVKDFPDAKELMEYEDYLSHPTKATASALITLTLESNWDRLSSMEGYAKYIALRPRAERLGEHGLFGDDDDVDLSRVMDELDRYTGNVWTHIISLHWEDAERLGYNHAEAWRTLLRTHRNDIAAAMKIPPEDFRWYAAFHDEGNHPHVHMMAWSAKPNQAYLSKDGIRQIKSTLTNQIFRQELLHVYEQKSKSRNELVAEARKAMLELAKAMREMTCIHPEAEQMIWDLSRQLGQVGGKKTYGYLPKPMKKLLERAAEQDLDAAQYALGKLYLSDDADVHDPAKGIYWLKRSADNGNDYAAYRLGKEYLSGKNVSKDTSTAAEYLRQAADNGSAYAQYLLGKLYLMGEGIPKDKEAAQYWFSVAEQNGHAYAGYFLDRMERQEDLPPPNILLSATRLLHHMGSIFRDNVPRPTTPAGIQIDHKRLQRLREKKMAMGHKWNDHENEQSHGMGGMSGM